MKIIFYIFILTCSSFANNQIFAADKDRQEEQVLDESNYEESVPMDKGRTIASKAELIDESEPESTAPERNAQECYQKVNQDDIDSCLENL